MKKAGVIFLHTVHVIPVGVRKATAVRNRNVEVLKSLGIIENLAQQIKVQSSMVAAHLKKNAVPQCRRLC
jgi:hypothetical protein